MAHSASAFRRRYYHNAAQLWHDLRQIVAQRGQPDAPVSTALRERLMLVVTSVNQCHYCARFHAQAAQLNGLPPDEIALLLGGNLHHVPTAELPALIYAQRWAEAGGATGEDYNQLVAVYGLAQAAAMERVLRIIWVGNLLGNSWDYLLFRLSGGRFGQHGGMRARIEP